MIVYHNPDEIVLRLKRGKEAGGFARFLEGAAEAIELGKILPTNPATDVTPARAADMLRNVATRIQGYNS